MSEVKPPHEFQPVTDPTEKRALLWEGAHTLCSAFIWTSDQTVSIKTHLTQFNEELRFLATGCPTELDPVQLVDKLARMKDPSCYFSVSLSRANIFFKADFMDPSMAHLKFAVPEKVFKLQRRKNVRFPIPEGQIMKVSFQDPLFPDTRQTYQAWDVSAGGISIIVSAQEAPIFAVGLELKNLGFTLNGRAIRTDAVVRHVQILPAGGRASGYKVGMSLSTIPATDAQFIAAHVFEEARKFYSKFL